MAKVLPFEENGKVTGQMIFCPACENGHLFNTEPDQSNGVGGVKPTWTFNGDAEKPTFRASMLVKTNDPTHPHYQSRAKSSVCHSMVTDGRIEFYQDSTHNLAGKTVDLPDFPHT